jgi:hypothetical protein
MNLLFVTKPSPNALEVTMKRILCKLAVLGFACFALDLTEPPPLHAQETKTVTLPDEGLTVTGYGRVMLKPSKVYIGFRHPSFSSQQESSAWEEKLEKAVGKLGTLNPDALFNIDINNFPDAVKKLEAIGTSIYTASFTASEAALKEATIKAKRLAVQDSLEEVDFWKETLKGQFARIRLSSIYYGALMGGSINQTQNKQNTGGGFGGGSDTPPKITPEFLTAPKEIPYLLYVTLKYKIE